MYKMFSEMNGKILQSLSVEPLMQKKKKTLKSVISIIWSEEATRTTDFNVSSIPTLLLQL